MTASDPVGHRAEFPQDLAALTSLRFLLALGVVLFHYHVMWPYDDLAVTHLIERGRLGVDVFFILSGFILTHVYRGQLADGRFDYGGFLLARLARIYPAHLAMLFVAVAMFAVAVLLGAPFATQGYTLEGLVRSLLLVQAWAPTAETYEWNGPAWSLSAEWAAYLAFPALAWAGLKLQARPLLLTGVAAALFLGVDQLYRGLFGQPVTHAEFNLGVLRIAPEFLFGIALYHLGQRLAPRREVAVGVAALVAAAFVEMLHEGADERLIVGAAGVLVLSLALLSKSGADRVLAPPALRLAGEASYALYLVHFPMIVAWKGASSALLGLDDGRPMYWPELAALLAVTLAAGLALHLLVERPARAALRGLKSQSAGAERREPSPYRSG
jgi:peptidoglycan/LPS O-acetylase OafA/YrhL